MRMLILFLSLALLSACGGGEPSAVSKPDTTASQTSESATSSGGVIPQSQLSALQKAKGVEAMMKDAEQKRREQMDAQE